MSNPVTGAPTAIGASSVCVCALKRRIVLPSLLYRIFRGPSMFSSLVAASGMEVIARYLRGSRYSATALASADLVRGRNPLILPIKFFTARTLFLLQHRPRLQ